MIDILKQPLHWSVAGLIIGLTVPILLVLGNKKFGISSSLRHICAMCVPANIDFFKYDWKKEIWNIYFVLGILVGGYLATFLLKNPQNIMVEESTKAVLLNYGLTDYTQILPTEIFNFSNIFTFKGLFFFVIGGFLVGFGTRYADGCTSGHAIMGLSNLQLPSLVATCCFMVGGFLSTHAIIPLFFVYFK